VSAKGKGVKLPWADQVDPEDFQHAFDYLSLHWLPDRAREAVTALSEAKLQRYLPGDILRTAISPAGMATDPLPLEDPGVRRELIYALQRGKIAPILCVNLTEGIVIADGRHRTSLAYRLAPFRKMPVALTEPFGHE
jgi:hypothetical protein